MLQINQRLYFYDLLHCFVKLATTVSAMITLRVAAWRSAIPVCFGFLTGSGARCLQQVFMP
jgi:hypothetical protein